MLVLASFVVGPFPMALVFNGFEIGAIFLAIIVANQVTQEGESTWFEGLQLLAVYAVLALDAPTSMTSRPATAPRPPPPAAAPL